MNKQQLSNKSGIINLAVLLGVGLFAFGAAVSLATTAASGLGKNHNIVVGNQTFYTAEAAASEGEYQYLSEFATNPTPTYDGGTPILLNNALAGSITVSPDPNPDLPFRYVRGLAQNLIAQRQVKGSITLFPEGLAFKYAIYSNTNLDLSGNANVQGNIFSNEGMNITGSAKVEGDAFSPLFINQSKPECISGLTAMVLSIPPPVLDPQPYQDAATAGGTFFDDGDEAADYLKNQERDGVVFANNTTEIEIGSNNTKLNGSLVTQGDLKLTGGQYSATDDYAAIVVFGNLTFAGNVEINGVVYVVGTTTFGSGTANINGSLISLGDISNIGGANVVFNPDIVNNWQNLEGLDTSVSSQPPRLFQWGEE